MSVGKYKLGPDLKKSLKAVLACKIYSLSYILFHYLQSPVMNVKVVLVQGLYFRMFPHKSVVIMLMVVDWVELVLDFRFPGMALDVHHVPLVSLYLINYKLVSLYFQAKFPK